MIFWAESATRHFFRTFHRKLLCSAATLLIAATGCPNDGKRVSTSHDLTSYPVVWNAPEASVPIIPEEIGWAVQGRPKELQDILELASQDVPPHGIPPLLKRLFHLNAPPKTYPNSLRVLGLNDSSIVTIVGAEDATIVAFRNPAIEELQKTVDAWNLRKSIHMRSDTVHGYEIHLTWNDQPDSQYLFTVIENGEDSWVFVGIPPRSSTNDAAYQRRAIEKFGEILHSWSTFKGARWSDRFKDLDEEKIKYFGKLSAYGTFYPAEIFAQLNRPKPTKVYNLDEEVSLGVGLRGTDHAAPDAVVGDAAQDAKNTRSVRERSKKVASIQEQILNELGQFEFATILNESEGTLSISIQQDVKKETKESSEGKGESETDHAAPTPPLGKPRGEMPPFSSLAPAGALGIVHLAFDPGTLFVFANALLPESTQNTLNDRLANYVNRMNYDVKKDLIDNLTGHATAFIYGLSPKAFEHAAKGSIVDLLLLRDARKSILIPFEHKVPLVEFLDITTQLFPKHFVRNGYGFDDIEYVWHDGETVKWGLFVRDHALIYVDSYEAYRRALEYDGASVDTLLSSLNPANSGIRATERRFSKDDHDTGIYLNLEGIGTLLAQDSYYSDWAAWLEPFSSVTFVSSTEDEHTVLEVDLTLKNYADTGRKLEDDSVDSVHFIRGPQDPRPN